MSLPVIHYDEGLPYYLEPLGEPETPKDFTSQQQCQNYYDLAKSEIQLYHDGTRQMVLKELGRYIHPDHMDDLGPVIEEYEDRLDTHASEFWYAWELKIDEISKRYLSGEDDSERHELDIMIKNLRKELDNDEFARHDPVWFLESRLTSLQKSFREWPNLIHLKTLFNLLNQRLPITALLWKQMSDVSMLRKTGEFGIYYHVNVLDTMRRLTELLVRNAVSVRDQYMRIRQHQRQVPLSPPVSSTHSLDPNVNEDAITDSNTVTGSAIPERSALRHVLPPTKRRPMTCQFCGSSDGHLYHRCELLEYVINMGVLSLNRVGSLCDAKGIPFDFEGMVPWCRSARFRAYLAKESDDIKKD